MRKGFALSALLLLSVACMPHMHVHRPGPPAHAKAHGKRAKAAVHTYHYYPDLQIYWHPADRYWMVLRSGAWVRVTARPALLTDAYGHVILKPAAPAPWKKHGHYKGKYPKGHLKRKHGKHKKHKWK